MASPKAPSVPSLRAPEYTARQQPSIHPMTHVGMQARTSVSFSRKQVVVHHSITHVGNQWGEHMDANDKTARVAGLLYLMTIVTGIFSLIVVPSRVGTHGDAAMTVTNIVTNETLFRLGIASGTLGYAAFLILPLALYKLLSPINRNMAVLMVALAVTCVPIYFVALAHQMDILSLVDDDKYKQLFTPDQLRERVMLSMDAYNNTVFISEIFWGLWLLPFGYLVFKSGFLSKVLGVLLMLGCFSYLISFFAQVVFPQAKISNLVMLPASFGEIGICLWLLIVGVRKPKRVTG